MYISHIKTIYQPPTSYKSRNKIPLEMPLTCPTSELPTHPMTRGDRFPEPEEDPELHRLIGDAHQCSGRDGGINGSVGSMAQWLWNMWMNMDH